MNQRSVFSTHDDVMGYLIVMIVIIVVIMIIVMSVMIFLEREAEDRGVEAGGWRPQCNST